jgi:hypothetical protein
MTSRISCSWGCGRDLCLSHVLWDQHDQPACKFCAESKLLKVRLNDMARGTERFAVELVAPVSPR